MMDRPDPAVAGSGSAKVSRPQRLRLRRIVGVKCVHGIYHGRDEHDVVALARKVEVGNDQWKSVDAVVHSPRKELANATTSCSSRPWEIPCTHLTPTILRNRSLCGRETLALPLPATAGSGRSIMAFSGRRLSMCQRVLFMWSPWC